MFPLTISPPCFDLTLRLSVSQCTFGKKRRFYRKYIQNKPYKQVSCTDEICTILRGLPHIKVLRLQNKRSCIRNSFYFVTGNDFISRAVSSQVLPALKGLTSVFGMRTGGSPSPLSPVSLNVLSHTHNCIVSFLSFHKNYLALNKSFDLRTSLDLLVSVSSMPCSTYTPDLSPRSLQGVSHIFIQGYLILRWVSRLDAFSVYPVQTSLPSCATGVTTGAQ